MNLVQPLSAGGQTKYRVRWRDPYGKRRQKTFESEAAAQAFVGRLQLEPTAFDRWRFCRSCGSRNQGPGTCQVCNVSTQAPRPADTLIGQVAEVRSWARRHRAIVIEETPDHLRLHIRGNRSVEESRAEFTESTSPFASSSYAWRLFAAGRAVTGGGIRASWNPELLASHALGYAKQSLDESRLFALEALHAAEADLLDHLDLPDSEKSWLRAWAASQAGAHEDALAKVLRLPPDGYPGKIDIIARAWQIVTGDPSILSGLEVHLAPFREDDPVADLLWRLASASCTELDPMIAGTLAAVDLATLSAEEPEVSRIRAFVEDLKKRSWTFDFDLSSVGPASSFLTGLSARDGGEWPEYIHTEMFASAPLSAVDDLIDLDVVDQETFADEELGDRRGYILARIAPELLDEADLMEIGFSAEIGRRALISEDTKRLESLPSSDDHLRRYQLLAELKAGSTRHANELLALLDGEERGTAKALVKQLKAKRITAVDKTLSADSSTWPTLARLPVAKGRAPRQSEVEVMEHLALQRILSRLHAWEWKAALAEARSALKLASTEAVRDEILNLLACAHWQLGHDEGAIQALEKALEDDYTEKLLANAGVVAAELQPQVAADHLGRLASEAPDLKLRLRAAMRATELWTLDPQPWAPDEEGEETLPPRLSAALRPLLFEPIELPDFRAIMRLLARWDDEWLANASLEHSPHHNTLEADVYLSLASGYDEFVKALARGFKMDPEADWLKEERDYLVGAAISALADDITSAGAATFGITLIDAGIPLEIDRRIPLTALSVASVAANIDPAEGEPKPRFLDLLIEAKSQLHSASGDEQERFGSLLDFAFNNLAAVVGQARQNGLREAADAYTMVAGRLQGTFRWQINREAVRQATDPILRYTRETATLLDRITPHVTDEELRSGLAGLRSGTSDLSNAIYELRR